MMSSLPTPTQVAGSYLSVYETYYNMIDPNQQGQIQAMDAAKFLKKSFLSDVILSKIWDIADPDSRGFLDKQGMFVALKLCALAQQGHKLTINNIYLDVLPPQMGELIKNTKLATCPQSKNLSNNYWSINITERRKYEQLFESLQPINGLIPGNKVKDVLMDSNLPFETLGKIWDLADIDKDGKLNQHEFIIAMHLVYKALDGNAVPSTLPLELLKNSNINTIPKLQFSVITGLEQTSLSTIQNINKSEWSVSVEDQKSADKLFTQADEDLDGFVSGAEIKDIFIQSGLSQTILARIWSLCDICQTGKLNKEQFALAMFLIKQKINGIDLPVQLTYEMTPPTLRKSISECNMENNNLCEYPNSELNMLSKDINEIITEKLAMEQNISQKEADIKIKTGEIKSLQNELDTLASTLKQLDNQKGEAQKRLNDLQIQVNKLRQQATEQEVNLQIEENELKNKRQEIESLKLEERNLETQQHIHKNHLNCISTDLQNIQLKISQAKASLTQLEEQQHQIVDVISQYDSALNTGNPSIVSESSILFKTKISEVTYNLNMLNDFETIKRENQKELFDSNRDCFNKLKSTNKINHCIEENCELDTISQCKREKKFDDEDPFSLNDKESYDPFNDDIAQDRIISDSLQVKDPFGEDPFAALHAPLRPESPSPALPPKKSKQPPPRPAPPRPIQGPQTLLRKSPPNTSIIFSTDSLNNMNSFENATKNTFDFADFAKFDQK